MRRALPLLVLAGCVPDGDPPWQLDHDRIVAVRAEPPAILPGEVALLEVLVAHAGAPTSVDPPRVASASDQSLYAAVHFVFDHWQVDGPDEAQLAAARAEMGLAADAPVPLDVTVQVKGPLYAEKRVLLGATAANPAMPAVMIDGVAAPGAITLGPHRAVPLLMQAQDVRWLTSCGELTDDREAAATLATGDACSGELVAVVRDGAGGVVWQVWPLTID